MKKTCLLAMMLCLTLTAAVAQKEKNVNKIAIEQYKTANEYQEKGNTQDAEKFLRKSAENGYAEAQRDLGLLLLGSPASTRNAKEAFSWIKKAADQGDLYASFYLAHLYRDGTGVQQDDAKANAIFSSIAPTFYDMAKELLLSDAHSSIGLFDSVIGMFIDPYSGWSAYRMALTFYYGTSGIVRDYAKAFDYFNIAYDMGTIEAAYYLGICYQQGRGTEKNALLSKLYFEKTNYQSPALDFESSFSTHQTKDSKDVAMHKTGGENNLSTASFNDDRTNNRQNGEKGTNDNVVYEMVPDMPSFPGGDNALLAFLANNIKYPKIAEEHGIENVVYVNFIVERDGSISDIKIENDVHPLLAAEAIRVIQVMPKWKPGHAMDGSPIRVKYTAPITFRLE